jgi:hypothetical protein
MKNRLLTVCNTMPHAVNSSVDVGFEVLTAVVMKSTVFWDVTPYSPLEVNRCFGGTYHLHFQGEPMGTEVHFSISLLLPI